MEFELLEDITRADLAFRVRGSTLDELFFAAAQALSGIMLEQPGLVRRGRRVSISMRERDLDMLLYDFLQEFVFYKDAESLILVPDSVKVSHNTEGYSINAVASGEQIDRGRHRFTVDIKSVTMHNLAVVRNDGYWSATVVLDV